MGWGGQSAVRCGRRAAMIMELGRGGKLASPDCPPTARRTPRCRLQQGHGSGVQGQGRRERSCPDGREAAEGSARHDRARHGTAG